MERKLKRMGCLLRKRRREMDLTLEEVSDRLGVSITTLHGYETGRIEAPSLRLFDLARVLRVKVGELEQAARTAKKAA